MKPTKVVKDYTTLAVGSAILGGIGGIAGKHGEGVVNASMPGMNILASGYTAKVGLGVLSDVQKLKKVKI